MVLAELRRATRFAALAPEAGEEAGSKTSKKDSKKKPTKKPDPKSKGKGKGKDKGKEEDPKTLARDPDSVRSELATLRRSPFALPRRYATPAAWKVLAAEAPDSGRRANGKSCSDWESRRERERARGKALRAADDAAADELFDLADSGEHQRLDDMGDDAPADLVPVKGRLRWRLARKYGRELDATRAATSGAVLYAVL